MNYKRSHCARAPGGFVIVLILVMSSIALGICASFLLGRQAWLAQSSRVSRQQTGELLLDQNLEPLRSALFAQLQTAQRIDTGLLGDFQATNAFYRSSLVSIAPAGSVISLEQSQAVPTVSIATALDPFEGAPARRIDFIRMLQEATPLLTNLYTSWGARQQLAEFSLRQLPVSLFTYYSSGAMVLGRSGTNAGRIHSNGSLQVEAGVVHADYPVTVAGDLLFSGGGALSVTNPLGASPLVLSQSISTEPAHIGGMDQWRAWRLGIYKNRILTSHDLPMQLQQAGTLEELVGVGSGFSLPCDQNWEISTNLPGGLSFYSTTNFSGVVVLFDYNVVQALYSGSRSFRLHCPCPNTIVLLRNARSLKGDFSLVTTQPIYVEAGFNDLSNPARAASLISGERVHAVPAHW